MPLQSRRIAVTALGINDVKGLTDGVHLRLAFDPRKGFPECGFELYKRVHRTGDSHTLDIDRLFLERHPALLRSGYSQDGLIVFQEGSARPDQATSGGIAIGSQKLGLTFRQSPFHQDSSPKVNEVRLRVRSRGRVIAEAFDDRHDGTGFEKTLVARSASRRFGPWRPTWPQRVVAVAQGGWSRIVRSGLALLLGDRVGVAEPVPSKEDTTPANPPGLQERLRGVADHSLAKRFDELTPALLPGLGIEAGPSRPINPLVRSPGATEEGQEIPGWRRFGASALLRVSRFLDGSVFEIASPFFGVTHDVVLRADLISLVELSAPAGSRVESVEYVEVFDIGWERFTLPHEEPWGPIKEPLPLLLPTADPGPIGSVYPTCPVLHFPRAPEDIQHELPRSRLDWGFVPLSGPGDVHGEYADAQSHRVVYLGPESELARVRELIEAIRELQAVAPSDQIAIVTSQGAAEETAAFALLPLVLLGSIDPSFARLAGLGTIDRDTKTTDHLDYKVVARWDGEEHSWITHDVFPGRDGALKDPAPAAAEAVPDPFRAGPVKTAVDLSWLAPSPVARLDRARQYVGYHIFRRRVDDPGPRVRLTESKDDLAKVATPDLLLLAEVQGEGPTSPTNGDQGTYRDVPPAYGTYDYGVQAQDLFGRRSDIVWTEGVVVPVLVDPPPVTSLYAFYLDTDDPEAAELVEDAATEILAATDQGAFNGRALLVSFRYPEANIEAIHGDVQAFEMSYRHGRPNELLGTLGTPSIVGPPPDTATAPVLADVDLTTVNPVPAGIDGYGGERARGTLASYGEHFAIESATLIEARVVRLRVHARRDYLPQEGEAALAIGGGTDMVSAHPLHISPTESAAWTGFDVRQPSGPDPRPTLRLSGTDPVVLNPPPTGVNPASLEIVRAIEPPIGEPGPGTDWVYRIFIPDFELPQPAGIGGYPGSVTVQVISGADRRSPLGVS